MITTILLGIVSSTVAEIVTAINKKLQGTVLQGTAAFLLALLFALIGGAIKVFYIDAVPFPTLGDFTAWKSLYPAFAEVWTISQIYFLIVTKNLNLDVQAPKVLTPSTMTTSTSTTAAGV